MLKQIFILAGLVFILAGCGGTDNPQVDGSTGGHDGIVNWNRDPYQVVFRAETVGGENADVIYRLNEVPACTVYGDGRVVWTEDNMSGNMPQVLFDVLSDEQVISLALYLSIDLRFMTYEEQYTRQLPSSVMPVYEKLTLSINDVVHVTDGFAEWPELFYDKVVKTCQTFGKTPRRFEPGGAWLSAQVVPYNSNTASVLWDKESAGFSFSDIASSLEKRWIEGDMVKILWYTLYDNSYNMQIEENGLTYQYALQIPGVTVDSPPAPQQ